MTMTKATATATATTMIKLVTGLVLLFSCFVPLTTAEKTVTLFIIAGDANVEGRAGVPELHDLAIPPGTKAHDNATPSNAYEHLVDDRGVWVTRDDVYVVYEKDRDEGLKSGPLSVKGFGHTPNTFGPDVEFGHVMGDSLEEKVVIIKAGWERRTLAKDFRPPSAEGGVTGFQFLRIVSSIQQTIQNLGDILGDEYANAEVDIMGLVWWHGYDDIKAETADEYETNLQCFMRDIREALEVPWMPILIAELGGQGTENVTQEELDFRAMQQRVVALPEFNETTRIVETAKYCVNDDRALTDDYTHYHGRAHTTIAVGNLMAIYMTELGRLDRTERNGEQIEADLEHLENNLRINVLFFFGVSMIGFVMFVAVMRGGISRASLKKAWADTVVALRESEKTMIDDDDDDFSVEGPSTEMTEGRAEENLVV